MIEHIFDPDWLSIVGKSSTLTFWPEIGIGYYPVHDAPYDASYFDRYVGYAATPLGCALTASRIALVNRFTRDMVIDIGIGCGDFIHRRLEERCPTFGYDINPAGIKWLHNQHLFRDPYMGYPESLSLWDVLEHIRDPARLLSRVVSFVFVSLPIFTDAAHVLRSKHFRKNEHCWYFTADGLKLFFSTVGFACLEESRDETLLGREDIGSFVFKRVAQ